MHTSSQLQLWRSWAAGEIDDEAAQARAEAAYARERAGQGSRTADRPQNTSTGSPSPLKGQPERRDKVFGPGRCVPLDRNAKCRITVVAKALMRRQEKGKAYGRISAKALAVLQALLWRFHNAASGRCFPSYEAIAEAAGCARSTVYEAIRALEQVGVLSWVNRIKRVREWVPGLFGKASAWRTRVIRTSNSYVLTDPLASKSDFPTGTLTQGVKQEKLLQIVGHSITPSPSPGRYSSSPLMPSRGAMKSAHNK
jgi:AraC-like DNA-binding protein